VKYPVDSISSEANYGTCYDAHRAGGTTAAGPSGEPPDAGCPCNGDHSVSDYATTSGGGTSLDCFVSGVTGADWTSQKRK
jgi:hypothetical protein